MTSKLILNIDPGDLTGWALMNINGALLEAQNLTLNQVDDKLQDLVTGEYLGLLEAIIYEDFMLFRSKATKQVGSRFVASQVIGLIKSFARRYSIKLVVQITEKKDIGSMWSGVEHKGSHKTGHYVDAYNHGFYYLRNTYQIPTALERSLWQK